MTAAEAADFEQYPDAEVIVRLRQWDDLAKEPGQPVGNLAGLQEMARRHLLRPAQ